MEVGTDSQFHYLRDWQQQVYEAGYLGMAWPKEFGGGGLSQAYQDIATAQCRAVKDGDEYVINGSKIWTSLGAYAKYMILLARTATDPESKYAGLSFFLSPMTVAGVAPRWRRGQHHDRCKGDPGAGPHSQRRFVAEQCRGMRWHCGRA